MKNTAVIILAAGKGLRMCSDLPKALCEISGRPMIELMIDAAEFCKAQKIFVIGGYKIDLLKQRLLHRNVEVLEQKNLLGSADAVKAARPRLKDFVGNIVVLYTDTPLIKKSTLKSLLSRHKTSRSDMTLLTGRTADPKDYGRIARDDKGRVKSIIEYSDLKKKATSDIRQTICEINIGAYCFSSKKLFEGLGAIKKNKNKGEYYLTDTLEFFYKKNYKISAFSTTDEEEMVGINRREELIFGEDVLRRRMIKKLLLSGVTIIDPKSTFIQVGAKIGKDTVIYPFVVIARDVVIGRGCGIGPFAHLRKGVVLKDGARIGNFVEVVRSTLGKGSTAKHLTYLGDTIIAENVNVGAGAITANYDGKEKHKTIIDRGAFIGSGTTMVAPVKIGEGAITGAGSVVVKGTDVPAKSVVVGVPAKPLKKRQA
ncbi:MAG: NTP transferase domain-containing protein [Candidatus Omnitrophota bacterium]